jgi:hypothetical protein
MVQGAEGLAKHSCEVLILLKVVASSIEWAMCSHVSCTVCQLHCRHCVEMYRRIWKPSSCKQSIFAVLSMCIDGVDW